jgi:hypothetical protein
MARELVEQVTDDLDGSKADRTVRFTWDGVAYEIDLSKRNAAAFTKAVRPYVAVARKVRNTRGGGRPSRSGPSRRSRSDRDGSVASVRTWARENGYQIAERGRIPAAVLAAYRAR